MAFVSEMFDQLRDLLNDASDTQVSFALKKRYLNRGIRRLWPRIYQMDTLTIAITTAAVEDLPLTGIADSMIVSVEYSSDADADNYRRESRYDIIPGDEDATSYIYLGFVPEEGSSLRIIYAKRLATIAAADYTAASAETWEGPDSAMDLPVLYAMALLAGGKIDDRQDATTYNTTQAINGVSDLDIMQASQFWMGQFELELSEQERPLPIARD